MFYYLPTRWYHAGCPKMGLYDTPVWSGNINHLICSACDARLRITNRIITLTRRARGPVFYCLGLDVHMIKNHVLNSPHQVVTMSRP